MVARTFSAALQGIEGTVIEIEASRQNALPRIQITGLPGEAIRESRERVRACLLHFGYDVPSSHLLVHLSPASSRKQGSQLDLAIAVSALVAEELLDGEVARGLAFLGELRLDGRIEPVLGALPLIEALEKRDDVKLVIVARENAWEAAALGSRKARLAAHLGEVLDFLRGERGLDSVGPALPPTASVAATSPCLDVVIGQELAKRALQVALAGRHHLVLVGPPGVGKSLLASCAPGVLPPLEGDEIIEVMKNHTHCQGDRRLPSQRPFRAPHHTISAAGLLGGGSGIVVPGEVTLAHTGVLFLDEFPEFHKNVLEGLREPLQNGEIHLHRVGHAASLPARFTLVAAMNPCPCGYALSGARQCRCPREKALGYRKRLSGPILDRMDLFVVLNPPVPSPGGGHRLSAGEIASGIARAYQTQRRRYGSRKQNGDVLPASGMPGFSLGKPESAWLESLSARGALSYRSLHKIWKVARTIADIDGQEAIGMAHLQEAWAFRCSESFAQVFG